MLLSDYNSIVLDDFRGLYLRGGIENTPRDYFSVCFNVDFEIGSCFSRPGLGSAINPGYANGKVRRTFSFVSLNGHTITLILDEAGHLYTFSTRSTDTATTARMTVTGAIDFAAVAMFGRVYLTFTINGTVGATGTPKLTVFIPGATVGADEFRNAAGLAPSAGGAMAAADGAAGEVNAGIYLIAVSYLTSSGFLTKPGPNVGIVFSPTSYTAPGSKKISLTSIPTGPTGTVGRQIIITKANDAEYFFLPSANGGVISNNSATTATLDFDDTTDLIDSADYLFDLMEAIACPVGLQVYNERLVTYGASATQAFAQISERGEPENFDEVDSYIQINPDNQQKVQNSFSLRNILYFGTTLGTYAVIDNNDFPSTWNKPIPIDETLITSTHSIANYYSSGSVKISRDFTLIMDISGILVFDGVARKPPVTLNILDVWAGFNFDYFFRAILTVDEKRQRIYAAFPGGAGLTENSVLIVGDYSDCGGGVPNNDQIKWTQWSLIPNGLGVNFRITDLQMSALEGLDTAPSLKVASIDGPRIFKSSVDYTDDFGQIIFPEIYTGFYPERRGALYQVVGTRMRITGVGTIQTNIVPLSNSQTRLSPDVTLASFATHEVVQRGNVSYIDAFRIHISAGILVGLQFNLTKLIIYYKEIADMLPL